MLNIVLIFTGAGTGGVCRYLVSNLAFILFGRVFPFGTLIVNVISCFFMGLLFVLLIERLYIAGPELRSLLLIGFLGGFSTFSALSIETLNLFERGTYSLAAMNIIANVTLCMAAVWVGVFWGRNL